MRKIFTSLKYIIVNKAKSENRFKRKIAHKKWKKNKNKTYQGRNTGERQKIREVRRDTTNKTKIIAPKNFSFIDYTEDAIKFTNELEKLYLQRRPIFIDLKNVECLDHSAITVLASILRTFKVMGIGFAGYIPENKKLKKLFIESDFFKYLNKQPTSKIDYAIGKHNQMFTTKNTEVNPELGGAIMEESSTIVWGEKRTCKGLQRVLLELMQNANNHADLKGKGVKHWWLSVNHDKKNHKVSFIFVDYGIGIFKSLDNKVSDSKWHGWKDKLTSLFQSNSHIFKELMDGNLHKTVTGKHFRGKGLPGIKEVLDRNQISNLHIVSNDVFANVSENKYNELPEGFNGTFVYWELNNKNESLEWIN